MIELEKKLHAIADNQVKIDELEKAFDEVAEELLSKSKLVAGGMHYSIQEIEFYFYSKHYHHSDTDTHCTLEQGEFDKWYFHKLGNPDNYTHSRRGVDITFGGNGNYGGILIRGLQKPDGYFIEGTSKVVKELIDYISVQGLKNLVSGKYNVFNAESPLKIIEVESDIKHRILKAKRFGLGKSVSDFKNKRYRYFNGLTGDYKCKDKTNVVSELMENGDITAKDIKGILGYNLKQYQTL